MNDYEEILLTAIEDAYEHCEMDSTEYMLQFCTDAVQHVANMYEKQIDAHEYVMSWLNKESRDV